MNIKNKKIGVTMLLSVASIIISIAINFTLTPFITNHVGGEAYGFVSLAKTFTSYANIFMVALNSYAARFLTIEYYKENDIEFKHYFTTVFIADIVGGGVLLLMGSICVLKLDSLLKISTELVVDVKLLFLLTFLNFFLTTINTVFNASSYVKDRLDLSNIIKFFSYVIEAGILLFCFIIFDASIVYVGVASVVMAAFTLLSTYYMSKRLLPNARAEMKYFSFDSLKKLVGNGLWNSINSIGNGLNSGLDLLITNLMLTGVALGQISIAKTLSNVVFQLYNALSQPFHPTFLKKYADENTYDLLKDIKKAMVVCGMFTNIIFAGFCAVGKEFLYFWIPTQDIEVIYYLVIIALLPTITEGCIYPAYYIYTLTMKNRFPCIVTIVGGLINVVGMYFLLKYSSMGVYAVLLTTAVVMNFINLVTNPIYMCRCLKIRIFNLMPTLFKNIICCLVSTGLLMYISSKMFVSGTIISFIIKAIFLAFVGLVIQGIIQIISYKVLGLVYKRKT